MTHHNKSRGFSLVELSIVLVILGLLVGGVLAGKSLIRGAELRSVATEYQRHLTAVYTFRDKYFALPGDMGNATAFWGAAAATFVCRSTDSSTLSDPKLTCNGNADGKIEYSGNSYEQMRTWQHLANAGLVEGQYPGITASGSSYYGPGGTHIPPSKISSSAGWHLWVGYGTEVLFPGYSSDSNKFWLSGPDHWLRPIMKPEEMWNIDSKLDDGSPASGMLTTVRHSWVNTCTTDGTATATYQLQQTGTVCMLLFVPGF